MNKRIYTQLILDTKNDVSKCTSSYIKDIFDVEVKTCDNLIEYAKVIDDAVLHRWFSKHWQNKMKKWKYSGVALIDEVNSIKPRAVLDVGCGYNEFKGKIDNLIGIDPYNKNADINVGIMDYRSTEKFDVILALGSVNFGGRNKIISEFSRMVTMLADGGTMFFRVNPGVQNSAPEARWIEYFPWNVPFIIELASMFNLKVLDIHDDTNQRKYFVYRKVK
jgi:hypothetical protein